VCKCVLYYCHRVSTQLQLTNMCIYIYISKIGPVVSVKAENFFTGLSVQFSLRTLHHHTGSFVNKLHTVCSEKSSRNS